MKIGKMASLTDVSIETVRYYQRTGLMRMPEKTPGGIRHYSENDLSRLRFIRRAKELGFSLRDIHLLLQLDETSCGDIRDLAEHKLADIHKRIADLESMARTLSAMIHQCETSNQPACPIIDSLTQSKT